MCSLNISEPEGLKELNFTEAVIEGCYQWVLTFSKSAIETLEQSKRYAKS